MYIKSKHYVFLLEKTCVIQSNISYAFYHIFGIPYLLRNNFKLSWNFALGFWSLLLDFWNFALGFMFSFHDVSI